MIRSSRPCCRRWPIRATVWPTTSPESSSRRWSSKSSSIPGLPRRDLPGRIRKDFNAPAPANNDHLLQSLITTVSALQKQVEQLSKGPASAAAAPAPAPAAPVPPSINVEDTFLTALSDPNHMVALPLINDFWGVSEHILPMAPEKKPAVSQSVILALLHKVGPPLSPLPVDALTHTVAGVVRSRTKP